MRVIPHRRDGLSHACCADVVFACLLSCSVHHRDYQPTVPDALVSYYLSRSGFVTTDTRVIRLIGLAAQKFIADVGNDALAQARLRMAAEGATGRGGKAARGGGAATGLGVDTRMTLTYVGGVGRRLRWGLPAALFCVGPWSSWCTCVVIVVCVPCAWSNVLVAVRCFLRLYCLLLGASPGGACVAVACRSGRMTWKRRSGNTVCHSTSRRTMQTRTLPAACHCGNSRRLWNPWPLCLPADEALLLHSALLVAVALLTRHPRPPDWPAPVCSACDLAAVAVVVPAPPAARPG